MTVNSEKHQFAEMLEQFYQDASISFSATPQGELLNEKAAQMKQECKSMLAADEQVFVAKCFSLLDNISNEEGFYLYKQGALDCIAIFKILSAHQN